MSRYWLLPAGRDSKLLTGPQLLDADVHPLRCAFVGKFSSESAAADAARKLAKTLTPEGAIARNVRVACDRRQTRRWRLSEQELDLLIAGHTLRVTDALGNFAVGYSRL